MSSSPPSHRAAGRLLVALLGALAMLGPFSNDSVLPSFPFIGATFSVTDVQVQQILTVYFVPFAFMMLLHGTLSDAFGRRRIILTGVAMYSLAALVCAFASSFEMFLTGRVLQGLSAGAGVVVGRAIIRDVHPDANAQRAMALLMIIFGVAPAIAPIIGGWLGHLFGWRAVFLFLSLLAACLLAASTRWLPETLPPAQRVPFSLREIGIGFSEALTNARFVMLMLAFGFNFAGFFIYIVASPAFGYRILGIEQTEFVWIFGPGIIGWVFGSMLVGHLAGRLARPATIAIAYLAMIGAALFNVFYHAHNPATLPVSVLPIFLYCIGLGMAIPTVMLVALDLMPARRGLASSMMGFSQSLACALLAGVIAHRVSESASTLARCSLTMVLCGVAAWVIYALLDAARLRGARA